MLVLMTRRRPAQSCREAREPARVMLPQQAQRMTASRRAREPYPCDCTGSCRRSMGEDGKRWSCPRSSRHGRRHHRIVRGSGTSGPRVGAALERPGPRASGPRTRNCSAAWVLATSSFEASSAGHEIECGLTCVKYQSRPSRSRLPARSSRSPPTRSASPTMVPSAG